MKHVRDVIKLGAPLMAGLLVEYVMYIADSVMVGRLGTEYLAAVAIGGMVSEILWAFTWTVAVAVQTFVSRRYGIQTASEVTDRHDLILDTGWAARTGFLFGFLAGCIALGASTLAQPLLSVLIEDETTVSLAMQYVQIIRWSMLPAAVFYAAYGFLAGIGKTRIIMAATILTNALNILINYFLIYGALNFPRMGIRGAALGTLLAQCFGLMFIAVVFFAQSEFRQYRIFTGGTIRHFHLLMDMIKAWVPVTAQNIAAFFVFLVYEGLISRFGTIHLAVIHIIFVLTWAGKTVSGGLAEGGSILVGNNLGRGDRKEAQRYVYACLYIGLVVGAVLLAVNLLIPGIILKIFNPEPQVYTQGLKSLRFFAIFICLGTVGYSLEIVFTHNGWGSFVLLADLASHIIFTLGFSWAAVSYFNTGIRTVWTGYGVYLAVFAVLLLVGFASGRWADQVSVETDPVA